MKPLPPPKYTVERTGDYTSQVHENGYRVASYFGIGAYARAHKHATMCADAGRYVPFIGMWHKHTAKV